MTLTEFVTARLDEDEGAAKAATHRAFRNWHVEPWYDGNVLKDGRTESADLWDSTGGQHTQGHGALFTVTADHIARHDPARVLREVEAGRNILAEYSRALAAQDRMLASPAGDKSVTYEWENGRVCALLNAIRGRAAVWRDHPDYDPAWAPQT